jgi:GAF domain-containing protein
MPDSILAAPLLSGDRVIGVMEVLDKISAPAFGLDDMEMLGLFADQAALAIDQSRQFGRLGEALMAGLARLADGDPTAPEGMVERLGQAVADREGVADLLALADLFNAVSALGPAERKAAVQVLRAFADYARSRPRFAR